MTIQEIHLAIDIEVDKSLSFEYPYIQPEVKDYWLDKAQIDVIDEFAHPTNPNVKGFEQGERRIDELREIVVNSLVLTPTKEDTIYKINLPNDYFRLVRHRCKTAGLSSNKEYHVGGLQTTQDDINLFLKNPFWKPIVVEPLYYILGNEIFYETDGEFKVLSSVITYLKRPSKMKLGTSYSNPEDDVQCDFKSEDMQYKIINKAVTMILENIESQRYQTNLNESNN